MGSFSLVHWLIVLLVILILFGRGRISEIMGDFGKGIKSFKQGINDEDQAAATPPPAKIAAPDAAPAAPVSETTKTGNS